MVKKDEAHVTYSKQRGDIEIHFRLVTFGVRRSIFWDLVTCDNFLLKEVLKSLTLRFPS
jgi:hypothetical protein